MTEVNWTEIPGLDQIHLALIKYLLKSMLQLMIDVFHSKEEKRNGSIFVSLGLTMVLLNP